jgi:hypothetical protein
MQGSGDIRGRLDDVDSICYYTEGEQAGLRA